VKGEEQPKRTIKLDISGNLTKAGISIKPLMTTIEEYPLMPSSQRDNEAKRSKASAKRTESPKNGVPHTTKNIQHAANFFNVKPGV